MAASSKDKKSVADVIIDRFLKDVDEKGAMPWQRPYERYNAFNYFSMVPYRGINRLMLPFGEYMTKNQILQFNKSKGYIKVDSSGKIVEVTPEAYKFQKGILWYPVVFFKKEVKSITKEKAEEDLEITISLTENKYVGRAYGYSYYVRQGKVYKERSILRYYDVADRKFFRNDRGECPPSRLETGEMQLSYSNPKVVFDNYVKREGIKLITDHADVPCYSPIIDAIRLNPYVKSEEAWYAIAFHEAGHSTGAANRLNREGVAHLDRSDVDKYAKEECIAEICSCLCCAETGISQYETSGTQEYDNSIAYVQSWKQRVKDWGKEFIYIVSQADKAFNYICDNPDSIIPESETGNE